MKKSVLPLPDILIPVTLASRYETVDECAANIREQYEKYGFTRFLLASPGKGWRRVGMPPRELYAEHAERFLQIRERLPQEISCGWWIILTVKSGPTPGWQRIIKSDGTPHAFATCPLDPEFRRTFAENCALFCSIAHPDFVQIEDDFSVSAAAGRDGCFCDYHLEEFAGRQGIFRSREKLKELLEADTPEALEVQRDWWELKKDSLVGCMEQLRRELDKASPEIPIYISQSGASDSDGDMTEAIARAAAGKDHIPGSRLHGTFYAGESIPDVPAALFNTLFCTQRIKGSFRFYHESDSYPHTRFFSSGKVMKCLMGNAYTYGCIGSVFQTQQILDCPNEDPAYGRMFKGERKRFAAVMDEVRKGQIKGVQLLYDPFHATRTPRSSPAWLTPLAHFGIPHTTRESGTVFLSGQQLLYWSDEEIRSLLSKNVFLDGEAAFILAKRGYSDLIGADMESNPLTGMHKYDLGGKEVITEKFAVPGTGRCMARSDTYAPGGNGELFKLTPRPGCEAVTEIFTSTREYISCGMTLFRNSCGGKVVIMAQSTFGNRSSSLFNYRRQKLIQKLLDEMDNSFPMLRNPPRVFAVVSEPEKADGDRIGMLTLTNLNPDPMEETEISLPPHWQQAKKFQYLDKSGSWQDLEYTAMPGTLILKQQLEYAEPFYIRALKG